MKWLATRPLWVRILVWVYVCGYVGYLILVGIILWPVGIRDWLFAMSFQAYEGIAWPLWAVSGLIDNL